ncbi:MAG: glycosyltransferase [Betaproteobacteria bacterium]
MQNDTDDEPVAVSNSELRNSELRNNVLRFSLVIPAYNESRWLPALLDSINIARKHYKGDAATIEIIVADNASTDHTGDIARAHGCRVVPVEKRAIAAARNAGAAIAHGEILCFIDADSRIHADTFNAIDAVMSSPRVIVGATGVRPERWSAGIAATWLVALPLVYLMRLDSGVVFCRRADFEAIGGYDETQLYAEDIQLLVDLKKLGRTRGQRFARTRGAVVQTSMRKFDKHGDWHYFTHMPRVAFWMLFNRRRNTAAFTQAYWYDDR